MSKVYIVVTHARQQADNKTHIVETCEFVDVIKDRHLTDSTVILDYMTSSIVKNRESTGTYDEMESYLTDCYPEQMSMLVDKYGRAKHHTE